MSLHLRTAYIVSNISISFSFADYDNGYWIDLCRVENDELEYVYATMQMCLIHKYVGRGRDEVSDEAT